MNAAQAPGSLRSHKEVDPDKAWKTFRESIRVDKGSAGRHVVLNPEGPKPTGATRFVCISDTHSLAEKAWKVEDIPEGDVLIHAGDFSNIGLPSDISLVSQWISRLPHRHKIVIAGNHDLTFDEHEYPRSLWQRFNHPEAYDCSALKDMLRGAATYLEDSEAVVDGIRIWGSPWQPWFHDWAFNKQRGADIQEKWDLIPTGIDILVTHGPPLGHGDKCVSGNRAGCVNLLDTIEHRVKPKVHIFGHIHEGYGVTHNGVTTFVNPSSCNVRYDIRKLQPPIVFDLILGMDA
jgi:predicted phosphodiesterase